MAKSIITQDGDVINYDNLVTVSTETCLISYENDDGEENEVENEELGIVAIDTTGAKTLIYHSPNDEDVLAVQRKLVRWLQSEAFSTFEISVNDKGGER